MADAIVIVVLGIVFLLVARAVGIGRMVRPGIGGLGRWRQDPCPKGVQEEYPDRPWGYRPEPTGHPHAPPRR